VTSTCDRCHHEIHIPVPRRYQLDRLYLPEGWLHVSGVTTDGVVFVVDLCSYCKDSVLAAAGVAKVGHK
jgi:hypothetical protein